MSDVTVILCVFLVAHFAAVNGISLLLLGVAAKGALRRAREVRYTDFDRILTSGLTMPVSVVIPAFNEEAGLNATVHSALRSQYPEFEVIVVDDGSTDRTIALAVEEFELEVVDAFYPQVLRTQPVERVYRSRRHPGLMLLAKANGRKADACNAGINVARHPYVLVTDADCVLHPEALLRTMRVVNLHPDETVCVGGQLRVSNGMVIERGRIVESRLPRQLVARFQVVEYASAFLGNRPGWSLINAVPVLSGAFNAWRRDMIVAVGGYTDETTHEDIELTLRVHENCRRRRIPYRIVSLPDPIVWTEVPASWRGIYTQRKRWQRVVYEVVWRFQRMLFNPRYGTVGMLAMPYLLLFEALGPFVDVAGWVLVGYGVAVGALSATLVFAFLLFSSSLTAILRLASLSMDCHFSEPYSPRTLIKLGLLALIEYPFYRPAILLARVVALYEFLRGSKAWQRVERIAPEPVAPVPERSGRG